MDFPTRPTAPSWVDFAPKSVQGLDLVGLRLPVQAIGYSLLDGVTTISPKVRYLGLRTLLADAYRQLPGPPPDSYDAFLAYARKAEAAFALAHAQVDPEVTNIIGIGHARALLERHDDVVPLENLNKQLSVNAYAGPAEDLGLVGLRSEGAPSVDKDRGLRLADLLRESWGHTSLGQRILSDQDLETATTAELDELAQVCHVDRLPEAERELLLAAVFPEAPQHTALERVRTYALLLQIAKEKGDSSGPLSERDLFEAARRPGYGPHPALLPALDGWLLYHIRDSLVVSHEAALREVVLALREDSSRSSRSVIAGLLEDRSALQDLWRDLGLPETGSDVLTMPLRTVADLVAEVCGGQGAEKARGLCRWSGGLDEWTLMDLRATYGTASLLLLPISWLLARRRAAIGVRSEVPLLEMLSLRGASRLGMKDVVLPRLDTLLDADASLGGAIAGLATLTVHQHIQIAMSRMAQDPDRDVAVVAVEGEQWTRRRSYSGGRPASRLYQAIGWLQQLGLIDDRGITVSGEEQLKSALDTITATDA